MGIIRCLSLLLCSLTCLVLAISCTTQPPAKELPQPTYQEPHRPQYHFSPPQQWMNDPNGMVYYEGEYHLFYQYHPESLVWGPMHWGHAVSKDLVHWTHLPIALHPDELGLIFSGSAVVDWKNTSGFGENGRPPLVAIFTHHLMEGEKAGRNDFQYQSIAYSNDKGRTWTKYEGNPVLPNPGNIRDFRDPKVFWHEGTQRWIMVLAAGDHVKIYSSPNLKQWQHESDFGHNLGAQGGVWECPDLFELTVENTRDYRLWVMLVSINPGAPNGGSGTQYFVGRFDGSTFQLEEKFAKAMAGDSIAAPSGEVFADFERGYSGWTSEGLAFGKESASGQLPNQATVTGYTDKRLANSFRGSGGSIGRLSSPEFMIEQPYIHFLIGGEENLERTALQLIVDGQPVRRATGKGDAQLRWTSWEVSQLIGKRAKLVLLDGSRNPDGYILADHIVFADQPLKTVGNRTFWLDHGRDNYAGVTWSDILQDDGRRIFIGWMSNWDYARDVPTTPWRSAMTIPRTLTLRDTKQGARLYSQPARELRQLRRYTGAIRKQMVEGTLPLTPLLDAPHSLTETEIYLQWDSTQPPESIQLELSNKLGEKVTVGLDIKANEYFCDRTGSGPSFVEGFLSRDIAPRQGQGNRVKLHLFTDVSSLELFADGGQPNFTTRFFPTQPFNQIRLMSEGGKVMVAGGNIHALRSVW